MQPSPMAETSRSVYRCSLLHCVPPSGVRRLGLVDRERRRQVAVGIDLREQLLGLLLDGCDGVGAGNPAQRRLLLVDDGDQGLRELGGIVGLLAAHRLPGGPGLGGALGVVVDRQVGVGGGLLREQLGAEEARLDDRGVDAERLDLEPQRLHPSFEPELRGGVGRAELLPDDARRSRRS